MTDAFFFSKANIVSFRPINPFSTHQALWKQRCRLFEAESRSDCKKAMRFKKKPQNKQSPGIILLFHVTF